MLRKILSYGVVAGLLVGVPLFTLSVAMNGPAPHAERDFVAFEVRYGAVLGYLVMLAALSMVFVAIKRRRDADLGGVIGFWPAFGLGLGVSLVAGVLYVVAWEAALAVTHMDFAGEYARVLIADQEAKGVGGEALASFVADMDRFKLQYANPLFRLPMTFAEIFPVGVLVSLVSAGLLRNSRFLPAQRK
jgi:hypothetical protein